MRRVLLVIVVSLLALMCGPSMTQVYDSNVRFEHCYRLDLDPNIATGHREACWRDWLERHTYGQTRDRVEYARRQVQQLGSGDATRPRLDVDGPADAGPPPTAPTEALTPTSADKPPPAVMKEPEPPPVPKVVEAGPAPPGASCARDCRTGWNDCRVTCAPDGGKNQCAACERDFKSCMKRCFSE